jgi:neutral ceramidase
VIEVGVGRAAITPASRHWPIWLSGYGDRRDPATGVHDDLDVRIVEFRSEGERLVLVVLDLMAMSVDWAIAVRREVADALGIAVGSVLTSTIHTHAAPSTITGTEALGWNVPQAWRDDLLASCRDAALAADVNAKPAELRFARLGLPAALSFNRRGHRYEPTYSVVDVVDLGGESRIATLVNAGVHPVVLGPENLRVSADWVGACRREVERRLGGLAVFVQGCQGDVDPHGMNWGAADDAAFAAVDRVGEDFALAAVAAAVVATPVGAAASSLSSTRRSLRLDVDGSPMAAITRQTVVEVELHEWIVGGIRFVSVPGEGFAQLGQAIVAARAPDPTVIVGFAPHWLGYLPVPFSDGYEEGLSYGDGAVDAIASALDTVP